MHTTTAKSKPGKMRITMPYLAVAIGHQSRTGHHVHDNRPRRQRSRGDAKRAAIRDD